MTSKIPIDAYIGIGSNLDNPIRQVQSAIAELDEIKDSFCLTQSSLYRSIPMGPVDQPDYINAVALLRTTLAPLELLDELLDIETRHLRERKGDRWGPRTLDLDMLLFGALSIQHTRLTVPHPGVQEREFVLYPLQEINPNLYLPGLGHLNDLIVKCPWRNLRRLGLTQR